MIHAYIGNRAIARGSTSGCWRHAVDDISHLCGSLDTECGQGVVRRIGPWNPDDPDNCSKCVRLLAGQQAMAS